MRKFLNTVINSLRTPCDVHHIDGHSVVSALKGQELKEGSTNAPDAQIKLLTRINTSTILPQSSLPYRALSDGTIIHNRCSVEVRECKCFVPTVIPLKLEERTSSERQKEMQDVSQGKGTSGVKDDGGKLRFDLLPWKAITGLVRVLTFGAGKYSPNGWKTVPNAKERYTAALLRHISSLQMGEAIDSESGLRHIDHIMCNAAFLAELED